MHSNIAKTFQYQTNCLKINLVMNQNRLFDNILHATTKSRLILKFDRNGEIILT